MIKIMSLLDLQSLISDRVEESTQLDYKSGIDKTKEKWKSEIAKDVSAMANSNGGVIIYGIKEYDEEDKRHLPEKIVPLDAIMISRETLMQVITNNISPKIDGVEIQTIPVSQEKPNEVVYVITIPQGSTVHQSLRAKQYFKRYGPITDAMEDYEIRDVMNRCTHPDIDMEFEIQEKICQDRTIQMPYRNPLYSGPITKEERIVLNKREIMLKCIPYNQGNVIAEHVHWFVRIPVEILYDRNGIDILNVENGYALIKGENLYRDILEESTPGNIRQGPPRIVPVLPKTKSPNKGIRLRDNLDLKHDAVITWSIYADCAPAKHGSIQLREICSKS